MVTNLFNMIRVEWYIKILLSILLLKFDMIRFGTL
jgi:hypothetical protein